MRRVVSCGVILLPHIEKFTAVVIVAKEANSPKLLGKGRSKDM